MIRTHISAKYLLSILFLMSFQLAFGQHYSEILQYSMTEVGGSARTIGVGGSLSALGADNGAITQNPAGLGRYRRSEFNLTLGLDNPSVDATFGTKETTTKKSFMGLPSIGMIFTSRPQNIRWKTMNFSVGYNRQITYNRSFVFDGDAQGSIINRFAAEADGVDLNLLDNYGAGLAYDVFGIYDDDGDLHYESDFDGVDESFYHRQEVTEKGSMGELTIALAGNYEEKLSLGLSLGVPFIDFNKEKSYTEEDKAEKILYFDKLKYDETLSTTGSGINVKLGMIYQVTPIVRAGLAVHSPTWINLNDSYTMTMAYNFTDGDGSHTKEKTPDEEGAFSYKVKTPWRVVASTGAIIGRKGFISADVEMVDYSAGSFDLTADLDTKETRDLEIELNRAIDNSYRQAFNFRVGGEYALDRLRFRGGLGFYGSAIKGDSALKKVYSIGVGYRTDGFFIDLAYRMSQSEEGYSPYGGNFMKPNGANLNTKTNTAALTVGFKF